MRTALVAIAKNEGPYIREWVLYHKKVCGFDEIFVYENDSEDDTRLQLEAMSKEGMCGWKPWPRSEHNPPQPKAYWDAERRKGDWDWMCLMDIDEFLVLNSGESVGEFMSGFDEKTGSVAFNWGIFYSKDKTMTEGPVTKRVNYCYGDPQVKSIARTEAIVTCGIHGFRLKEGYKYMHCSGREYDLRGKIDPQIEATMCKPGTMIFDVRSAHVNHYMMKSEEEVIRRDDRGDACKRHHAKKRTLVPYRRLLRAGSHRENHNIKRYIEARYGLEKFYQDSKRSPSE